LTDTGGAARRWNRLDGVDVLRGLAILLVLLNHVNMRLVLAGIPYGQSLPRQLLSALVWSGQYGVQIFFAVSGFLITSMSMRRWGAPARISTRTFYLLRVARIAPLLLLLLLVLILLHFTESHWFHVTDKMGGLGRAVLAALTFRINVLEARLGYLPGSWDILWSLSVEEAFYLGFPIACLLLGRRRWFFVLLAIFVAMGPVARTLWAHGNEVWQEYSYLGGMDAIALGCLTALLVPKLQLPRRGALLLTSAGTTVIMFILGFSITVERLGLARLGLGMTIIALGTCMVMAAVSQHPPAKSTLFRPLIWMGRRSYEIYLTHMFVVIGCFVLFIRLGAPAIGVPVMFAVVILGAGFVGELVRRFYSEPANQYLRKRWHRGSEPLGSDLATH
jgi:peptidoglycan/LPS O-acetylase OafA/YrhL